MEKSCKCGKNCKHTGNNLNEIIKTYLDQGMTPQQISDTFLEGLNSSVKELEDQKETKALIKEARKDLVNAIVEYLDLLGKIDKNKIDAEFTATLYKMLLSFEDLDIEIICDDEENKLKNVNDLFSFLCGCSAKDLLNKLTSLDGIFKMY